VQKVKGECFNTFLFTVSDKAHCGDDLQKSFYDLSKIYQLCSGDRDRAHAHNGVVLREKKGRAYRILKV
jgi:hypothetical protein